MTDQGIKSRPRYIPIAIDPGGRRHLLIAETGPIDAAAFTPGTEVGLFDERWTVAGHSRAIPSPLPGATDHEFRATAHLMIALRQYLNRAHMGLRIYAVGTEHFLWDINALAEKFGMSREELRFFAVGSGARRVFCNHCRTITPGVTTNIVTCSGCGANLFVRDHFSRRLNAFAGVQVDAEVPGDIPDIEELY